VFRPAGRKEELKKNKEIIYYNSYRFDIHESLSQPRNTWIHLSDNLPGYA
jgi:hypothetical protein